VVVRLDHNGEQAPLVFEVIEQAGQGAVHKEMVKYVYDKGQGAGKKEEVGDVLYNRGLTAAMMTVSVLTWAFSSLKFQSDMGILLAFMFMVNVFGDSGRHARSAVGVLQLPRGAAVEISAVFLAAPGTFAESARALAKISDVPPA